MKWLLQTRLWSAFASSRSARLMFASHCLRRSSLNFFVSSPWCNNIEGNRKNWNFPFSRFELWLQPNTAQRCGILIRETDCETIPASAKHVRGYPPTWPTSGFLIHADVTCKQRIVYLPAYFIYLFDFSFISLFIMNETKEEESGWSWPQLTVRWLVNQEP